MQEKGPDWRLDRVFKTYDMGEVEGGELSSWVPADPARAPSTAGDRQLTRYRRNVVGFVFQFFNLIPDLTSRENVSIAAELVDSPLPTEDVLDLVGMSGRIDRFTSQMSGDEQKRRRSSRDRCPLFQDYAVSAAPTTLRPEVPFCTLPRKKPPGVWLCRAGPERMSRTRRSRQGRSLSGLNQALP